MGYMNLDYVKLKGWDRDIPEFTLDGTLITVYSDDEDEHERFCDELERAYEGIIEDRYAHGDTETYLNYVPYNINEFMGLCESLGY